MKKTFTCIVCPIGCQLEVTLADDGELTDITGNTCKRGYDYASRELTDPRRTLTTTVRLDGAAGEKFLPVRTASPIPKPKLFEAMALANSITVKAPIKAGDVICADFVEKGIDLIACKNVEQAR